MRVAFRVDGSGQIGVGHLRRCGALAEALRATGAEVLFVSRPHDGVHAPAAPLAQPCAWLPAASGATPDGPPAHAPWLGVPWQQDAADTALALASFRPDWLVVDHYALDARWHGRLRETGCRIVVIDDLADRPLDADLLLDQNLHPDHRAKYAGRLPAGARLLGGPRYALLAERYAAARAYAFHPVVRSIGIFVGGGDLDDAASMALRACREDAGFRGPIELVSASGSPHHASRIELARQWPATSVLSDLPDLCDFFARHDLQVGAGGSASWERCCLAVPTVAFSIARNQEAVLPELAARGAVVRVEPGPGLQARLGQAVAALAQDADRRHAMAQAARGLLDGQGATRVAAVLAAAAGRGLRLRPAAAGDEALLLHWANDLVVRRQAFNPEAIEAAGHAVWFANRLADPTRYRLHIAQTMAGVPVGQVRFEWREGVWELGYSLDEAFRGWGLATDMVRQALRALAGERGPARVLARVKAGNPASCQVFRRLGFDEGPMQQQPATCHVFTLQLLPEPDTPPRPAPARHASAADQPHARTHEDR